MTKPKSKGGRKGKYEEWLTDDGLLQIEGWARDGLTDEQIAKNVGIVRTTLYDWIKKFPDFSDALKRGKAPVDLEVENALLKRARGYDYEEVKTVIEITPSGERKQRIEKVAKHIAPDVGAISFWLKNRQPDKWRKMSPEFKAKIEAETKKLQMETAALESQIGLQDDIADDGFIEALSAEVDDVWSEPLLNE